MVRILFLHQLSKNVSLVSRVLYTTSGWSDRAITSHFRSLTSRHTSHRGIRSTWYIGDVAGRDECRQTLEGTVICWPGDLGGPARGRHRRSVAFWWWALLLAVRCIPCVCERLNPDLNKKTLIPMFDPHRVTVVLNIGSLATIECAKKVYK